MVQSGERVPVATSGELQIDGIGGEWWACARREQEAVRAGHRINYGLTVEDFSEGYAAIAYANACGVVMDSVLDVTWSTFGMWDHERIAACHHALVEYLSANFGCIEWVLELGSKRGLHSHLMFDTTALADFTVEGLIRRYLILITDEEPIKDESGSTFHYRHGKGDVWAQWARFKYQMKGLSPYAVLPAGDGFVPLDKFVDIGAIPQGVFDVQRIGWSDGIGRAARAKWIDVLPDLSVRADGPQLYTDHFLNWHRQQTGQEHFEGEVLPRNARPTIFPPQ